MRCVAEDVSPWGINVPIPVRSSKPKGVLLAAKIRMPIHTQKGQKLFVTATNRVNILEEDDIKFIASSSSKLTYASRSNPVPDSSNQLEADQLDSELSYCSESSSCTQQSSDHGRAYQEDLDNRK